MEPFHFNHKRVLVTGAASGIGLAIARAFARSGAMVAIVDLESEKAVMIAQSVSESSGTHCFGFGCDVSNEASVAKTFAAFGDALDILINCAGIAHVGNLLSTSPEEMDELYAINVRGTYLCMRSALKLMILAGGGIIINMASIAATAGLADRFAYSMTKGAVLSMTLSVAKDYISHGIRCNCISPARVHTPFVDGFVAKNYPGRQAEKFEALSKAQPIGRMATPEEVASLALYLCSDSASFLTGVDFPMDGGFFNLR